MRTVLAADLFCGAGGTSSGLYAAADELGLNVRLLAVNHWPVAIATHSKNHTHARHVCASLDLVDPRKEIPGGKLDLLVASPECTHHSNARGGKPMNDQSRASAWHVLRWVELLNVENVIIENVQEFANWGPLARDGKPIKGRKGEIFQAFIKALVAFGYAVDWRVLNAADYGDPTTRRRLFIIAQRRRRAIRWPEPTHASSQEPSLLDALKPWRPAKEIIDWAVPSQSIFARKRPLSPNTMRRIAAGLRRFAGLDLEPYLVMFYGTNKARSTGRPLPTVTANGNKMGLCEPFILSAGGPRVDPRSVTQPLNTVLARDHMALCQPFIVGAGGPSGAGSPKSTGEPLSAILAENHKALVCPFLSEFHTEKRGEKPRVRSVEEPLPTQSCENRFALCEPILVEIAHGYKNRTSRPRSVNEPLRTITAKNGAGLAQAFLVRFNNNGRALPLTDPLPTLTAKDRLGLVTAEGDTFLLDIHFRMLQPHELAAGMGFPKAYEFSGTRADQVRQIGNAVPVNLAKALCRAVLE